MSNDAFVVRLSKKTVIAGAVAIAAVVGGVGVYFAGGLLGSMGAPPARAADSPPPPPAAKPDPNAPPAVDLTESQAGAIKTETVTDRSFPQQKLALGNIDFNEDQAVLVYPPYQGLILQLFAKIGDDVQKGQTLFTIQSPDLIQAESTLISAAGVLDLTQRALSRARQLFAVQGIAQKDLEQAVSDEMTAEGNLRAARDAVRVFGKTDDQIDQIVKSRKIDPALVVTAPIPGRITARTAAPGDLVQPGSPPAPYAMADLSTIWMQAFVPESDTPLYRVGQEVKVSVMAYPGKVFEGTISTIGATVDPNTHRLMTRSAIQDPDHLLRPNMLATFVITTGPAVNGIGVPFDAVVREPDGTMTAWVTTDKRHYTQRIVKLGLQDASDYQIVDGLKEGETIATEGAILLDNIAAGGATD
ncbi:MAG TPA: efflux RND transporter periplasmic adaptor subunit [Stellaceae bacterium]|jgi:cobalt-zinc-cadmium efflux system membrane fusion protein|nr:efflux RND transporter periplasmic adaptor subunit [Stellaceae bacterium]